MTRPNRSSTVVRVVCATLALLMIGALLPASAAKVYRCGNVFQDQPCTTGKDGEVPAAAKAPAARDALAPAVVGKASTVSSGAPTPDRLVPDAPRAVAIEARR